MNAIQYYSMLQAKRELRLRRKDRQLAAKVNEFMMAAYGWPEGLPEKPFVAICRQVATARFEDLGAHYIGLKWGLPVLWLEYIKDKFTTSNEDKANLGRLYLFRGWNENQAPILDKIKLTENLRAWENLSLCDIALPWGERLVDFHHRLRHHVLPKADAESFLDCSPWLCRFKGAQSYYPYLLALSVHRQIMLEDFDYEKERAFRKAVVIPAYQKIAKELNVQPLVVRLPWQQHYGWYPAVVREYVSGAS